MAASSHSSQLKNHVSCSICAQPYDNHDHVPKILPCQHTFCEGCINKCTDHQYAMPSSIQCPTCRRDHVIPQGGFITCKVVLDIVDELQNTPGALQCTNHAKKEVVVACLDCLDTLCPACIPLSMRKHANHYVMEIESAAPVLMQRLKARRPVLEDKLSLLEALPFSAKELKKIETNIHSLAKKLHDEINKWEIDQQQMVQGMIGNVEWQKQNIRHDLDTISRQNNDVDFLLLSIQHLQHRDGGDDDFREKLRRQKLADQQKLNDKRRALLHTLENLILTQEKYY